MDENRIDVAAGMTTSKPAAGKPKWAARVSEIETLRTANRKVFRMNDGSEQAVLYSGTTREQSDALELDADGKYYRKRGGSFGAAFSCDETNSELFSMEMDTHRITISSARGNGQRNSGKIPKLRNKTVLFEGMDHNIDMEYSILPSGVKENIVVKQQANTYCYPFIIHCENVFAKADRSAKLVKFVSNETGKEVFFIPAPFMVDANGIVSTGVIYELENMSDSDIQLTVVADSEWINNQARAFPVTIDPQVMISGSTNIQTYSWTDGIMTAPAEHVVGKVSGKTNRMYLHFNMPTLPNNPRIKKAELVFYQKSSINNNSHAPKLGLFQITEDIATGTTTPAQNSRLIDFEPLKIAAGDSTDMISYNYDITRLVDAIHSGESSYQNLVLEMMETPSNDSTITLYGSTDAEYAPTICVTYESSYGVNSSYRTHTHEIGRFGQGSVDLACGNLMFECQDFGWTGNRMPVTLKRLYTSALATQPYTRNSAIKLETADFSAMKLGFGWKLNIMQSMMAASFQHEGEMYDGYVYIGENGDEVYFKLHEAQTGSLVSPAPTQYEAVDDSSMIYTPSTRILEQGGENYLFDESGRLIRITDEHSNCMSITYVDNRITGVTDGVGRSFAFAYDTNGQLTSITAPDASSISYSYSNGRLSGVTYPDGSKAVLSYNTAEAKLTVCMRDSTDVAISAVEYYFVAGRTQTVAEYAVTDGTLVLGKRSNYVYSASTHATGVQSVERADPNEGETTQNVVMTIYTFDDNGEVINEYAYTQMEDKTGIESTGAGIHPYYGDGGINTISASRNLLLNQNFDNSTYWEVTEENENAFSCSRKYDEAEAKYGNSLLMIQSFTDECEAQGLQQTVTATRAGEYTFSAYLRLLRFGNGATHSAYIRVVDAAGNVLAESEHIRDVDDYIRVSASFELASAQNVTAQILMDGKGTVYANAAQLEYGACASDYNLLLNGSFTSITNPSWVKTDGVYIDNSSSFWGPNGLQIDGSLDEARNAGQAVPVCQNRSTRETFTLSGWAKGYSVPIRERGDSPAPTFRLRAVVHYADSDYDDFSEETFTADFSAHTEAWHYASVQFAKSKYRRIENIEVFCDYDYNFGTASFDDIQLVRNSIEKGLSAQDFPLTEETFDEDIPDAAADTAADAVSVPEFAELEDGFGNALTETTFTDGEFGTVYRSFGYDENGNNLICETDARGNQTVYTVDPATSRNTMVTDRCGNKTLYEYDIQGRTSKVTSKKPDDTELANVSYTYDTFDNLTEIVRGDGLKYVLQYDQFHNLQSIGVDGKAQKLVHYTYKTGNGRLKQVSYANGDFMKAVYNNLGQMVAEKWYNTRTDAPTAHYKYAYDSQNNIVRSVDILACKEYNYTYEEGRLLRSTEFDITISAEGITTAKHLVHEIRYTYDAEGEMIRKRIIPVSGTEQVIYYQSDEGKNSVVKFTAGGNTVTSHSKNDSFGRKVFDELQLGSGYVSRQFLYHAGEATQTHEENAKLKSTPTTNLVSQITLSDGRTLSYEYDNEERITKVIDSVDGTTEYTYDALGQLLEEKVNGTVVNTMTYDNYGNILTKNGKSYTYDDVWKDMLCVYGGQPILYNHQGNPIKYLGHDLTWEKGRQLKSFDSNTYTYNANGIRTSKTVNGVKHTYTLDGVKILRETWGDNTLIPLYDNEESICGILYNDTPYYFLKNLQGDIISITNQNGQIIAKYRYDAWGVCTIISDSSDCSIATINPFRYRGYYYDPEIGMYYLQSRYYDSTVGRFLCCDIIENVATTSNVLGTNLYAYCECDAINNIDCEGNVSWKKALSIFNTIGKGAKKLLDYLYDSMEIILGIKTDVDWKMFSKIAKEIKRSPHRVKHWYNWLKSKLGKPKTNTKKIVVALAWILFFSSIAAKLDDVKSFVKEVIKEVFTKVAEGIAKFLSWLVTKGIKFLSKFVPALGGAVGMLLGKAIGRLLDIFFEKNSKRIIAKYLDKIDVYRFKSYDYLVKYFACLA